jgi:hypothetical protein
MMTEVNNAVITMKLSHLIGVGIACVIALLTGFWAVWALTVGGVQADVAAIRSAVDEVKKADVDTLKDSHVTEVDLRDELATLTAQLRETNISLKGLDGSVSGLNASIKSVDTKPTASIAKQDQFEQWVVARLAPGGTQIPSGWSKDDIGIVTEIVGKSVSPLVDWYKMNTFNPAPPK